MDMATALDTVTRIDPEDLGVFVGAGLSSATDLPTWEELVVPYADEMGLPVDTVSYPRLMQYFCGRRESRRARVLSDLEAAFSRADPTPSHRLVARLALPRIWTTNYDDLLERAFDEENRVLEVITSDADLYGATYEGQQLVKMHGSLDDDEEIVLLESDYERYRDNRPRIAELLEHDLTTKSMLFLGVSFDDPNIRSLASSVWGGDALGRPHFLFTVPPDPDDADEAKRIRYELWEEDLSRYGVETVELEDYTDIEGWLYHLLRETRGLTLVVLGKLPEPSHTDMLEALGRRIAEQRGRIHTGGGPNVGTVVAEAAADWYARAGRDPTKYITFFYREGGGSTNPARGKVVYTGDSYADMRKRLISAEKVCVVVGEEPEGDTGMGEEIAIARRKGARLLPLAYTGATARRVWEEEKHHYTEGGVFESRAGVFGSLKEPPRDVEGFAESVIALGEYLAVRSYDT